MGSVETQCSHQRRPKEHFERVPKQSTVNRGTATGGGPSPGTPSGEGRGEGGQAFELYLGSTAEGTKYKGNQY